MKILSNLYKDFTKSINYFALICIGCYNLISLHSPTRQHDTFIQYNDKANIKIIHETQLQIILLTISLYVVENCVCLLFTFEIFEQ